MTPIEAQARIIAALSAGLERKTGMPVQRFETHISIVLVTAQRAWKFKKPLALPYLDYSTLERRRFYCHEEVRINRCLAPALYLGVVAIAGSVDVPRWMVDHDAATESEEVLDYAVEMRSFAQESLWAARACAHLLSVEDTAALADRLARFHETAPVAPQESAWGSAERVIQFADASFAELRALLADDVLTHSAASACLENLIAWDAGLRSPLMDALHRRKVSGRVRECHGDLHCGNLLTLDGQVQAFDAIEFNDSLRWIDVMNDIAFVHMDLGCRGQAQLAADFLSRYLEASGDYAGLRVLRHYLVQRALIRAKVLLTRVQQTCHLQAAREAEESSRLLRDEGFAYLAHALHLVQSRPVGIGITHGLSGSGKTTFARLAVHALDAVQLRSDVERKRLHGVAMLSRPNEAATAALYASDASAATYDRLASLATEIVRSGWSVIVDAAFLTAAQRRQFRVLADTLGVPFLMFDMQVDIDILRQRLRVRETADTDASDAGIAVLEHQLRHHDPITTEERAWSITVHGDANHALGRAAKVFGLG